jgi:N-acylneuraminate cytidylyltransferase
METLIISKERNPVVTVRAQKLKIPVLQAIDDKAVALRDEMRKRGFKPEETIYVGNDINDLPVLDLVGFFAAPADSYPEVLRRADLVLNRKGGKGVLRELCDKLIRHWQALPNTESMNGEADDRH